MNRFVRRGVTPARQWERVHHTMVVVASPMVVLVSVNGSSVQGIFMFMALTYMGKAGGEGDTG